MEAASSVRDDVFRAVVDPTRRQMLEMLRGGPLSVGAISQSFAISQPAVSQHLKVLRDAGTVQVRSDGRLRIYELEGRALREVYDWSAHFETFWTDRLGALGRYLDATS